MYVMSIELLPYILRMYKLINSLDAAVEREYQCHHYFLNTIFTVSYLRTKKIICTGTFYFLNFKVFCSKGTSKLKSHLQKLILVVKSKMSQGKSAVFLLQQLNLLLLIQDNLICQHFNH